jgi:hypothetical protein
MPKAHSEVPIPPVPASALPEILSQALPSFEYQPSEPARPAALLLEDIPVSAKQSRQPLPIDIGQGRTEVRPFTPALIAETDQFEASTTQRLVPAQTWTPPVSKATPLTTFMAPEASVMSSVQSLARMSVDPQLSRSAAISDELVTAPLRMATTVNAISRQRVQTGCPAKTVPVSNETYQYVVNKSTQPLSRPEIIPQVQAADSSRLNPTGVFARDQVMPWTFHVLNGDRQRLAVMSIEVMPSIYMYGRSLTS